MSEKASFPLALPPLLVKRAVRLALDEDLVTALRTKLWRNRLSTALFDTDRYRRNLEAAYRQMWRIWKRGEAPRAFAVEPQD